MSHEEVKGREFSRPFLFARMAVRRMPSGCKPVRNFFEQKDAARRSRNHNGATETAKRRQGDAAKNQLSLNGLRDTSSKILTKLREVGPQ